MKEALYSSETKVHTGATRRNNPEDNILPSHHRENLKSYMQIGSTAFRNMWQEVRALPSLNIMTILRNFT
jgi:hypothetical protein